MGNREERINTAREKIAVAIATIKEAGLGRPSSREESLAVTKLEEASLWLHRSLEVDP